MLKISKFVTGPLETNVYFLIDTDTHKCVVVDPADNADHIINIIDNELLATPLLILLTHAHFDHMTAAKEVAQHYGIGIRVNALDESHMQDPEKNLSKRFYQPVSFLPSEYDTFKDGDTLKLLDRDIKVIGTPGHTPGSSCFFIEEGLSYTPNGAAESKICPVLIAGDTLFQGSFGKTDFPGGSEEELFKSIKEKLLVLPDNTSVFPGHGPQTSIALEKRYNPAAY